MGSTKISAPPPRDYAAEMEAALRAQIKLQPELLAAEKQYLPQWQQLQEEKFRGQTNTMLGIYGDIIPAAKRLGEQQLEAMTPVMGNLATTAQDIYRRAMGPQASGLLSTMLSQAENELALGRGLSQEETMMGQQAARAAMQARGLQGGNQAVAAEVLNNYNLGMQREAMRRNYAAQTYGLAEASSANAYNQYGSPLMQMVGATSPAALLSASGNMMQGLGPQLFNPESSYNAALQTANRQEAMQTKMANQSASNAMKAAWIGFAGNVLGGGAQGYAQGMASGCWVARAVYGEENPAWLVFQDWMLNKSPSWFRELYLKHGEKFAKFIKNKPMLKRVIRGIMNVVVDSELSEHKTLIA